MVLGEQLAGSTGGEVGGSLVVSTLVVSAVSSVSLDAGIISDVVVVSDEFSLAAVSGEEAVPVGVTALLAGAVGNDEDVMVVG